MSSGWPKIKGFVGLHAKSYTWMVEFDRWARNFLSTIYDSSGLDLYYTSVLQKWHTYYDRYRETANYLNFMITTDETRIDWMYPTKTFSRKTFIEYMANLENLIGLKNEKDIYYLHSNYPVSEFFKLRVRETRKKVNEFLNMLYFYLKSLVIKFLLVNRSKERAYDADKLRTDAFNVLLSMLEKYNLDHAGFKVPFTSQLMWLSKPKKKEIIDYEMWGFGEDAKILSITPTDIEGENYSSTENRTITSEAIEAIAQDEEETEEKEEKSQGLMEVLGMLPSQLRDCLLAASDLENIGAFKIS